MPAYNFKKEFALQVERGEKRCTIRRVRKRRTVPGDQLHLFTGMRTAYCRKLRTVECMWVESFEINADRIVYLSGMPLSHAPLNALARADGFSGAWEFIEFFRRTYGLPFTGAELIRW